MSALSPHDVTPWHARSPEDVLARVRGDAVRGLDPEEAARRLARHGPNTIADRHSRSLVSIVLRQLGSPLVALLGVAAAASFALGHERDAFVILVVVVLNTLLGTLQEGRAERSLEELRRVAELRARVIRGGHESVLRAGEIVPGDVLLLAAGDAVGADARLIDTASLQVAEASLTGESVPLGKDVLAVAGETSLGDRHSMVYAGTHVVAGRARAVVVATGASTEVGRIATLTATAREPRTPLERRIARFGRRLLVAAALMFVLVMGIGLFREIPFDEIVMVAISQTVGMIPEGLPVAVTIALAAGVQRMARRGAIVRRLSAVETLGSTTVLCSDKTGTLTRNEMTVTEIWLPSGRTLAVGGEGYAPEGGFLEDGRECAACDEPDLLAVLEAAAACNDAGLIPPDADDPRWRPTGDPTEASLLAVAAKAGADPAALRARWPRLRELPFDPAARWMATEHAGERASVVFIKGAPEVVFEHCARVRRAGQDEIFTADAREAARATVNAMAARALRVLAVARIDGITLDPRRGFAALGRDATLLGLVGQIDPPRAEARAAVEACRVAGVRVVMVTGDHAATGIAVARQLGIAREGDEALEGSDLARLDDAALASRLDHVAVFARVQPEAKLRLVELHQRRGDVVAMTGDGVNDAPALARADVGVAMGIAGTEVAKQAAKIVITDDRIETLVAAVEEGRLVHANLQKVLLFLFATSVDEVLLLMLALVLGYPLPLAAVQILWINVVTEGLLTVNLAMEPREGDEMRRPPVPTDAPLLPRSMLRRMAGMVAASVAATFGWYTARLAAGIPFADVQTETFTLLAVCQWFNALSCRSELASALWSRRLGNPWLVGGVGLAVALQLAVLYLPAANDLFHTVPLAGSVLGGLVLTGSLVLWVEELRKLVRRRRGGARRQRAASP